MGIQVQWDDDSHRILYFLFEGRWRFDELDAALCAANEMTASVEHAVDIIIDLRQSHSTVPRDLSRHTLCKLHPNTGVTLFIGSNLSVREFWNAFLKLYNTLSNSKNYLFAPTLESARSLLLEWQLRGS